MNEVMVSVNPPTLLHERNKQEIFHNCKNKFWGSSEIGFLDRHTMSDACKCCVTNQSTLTNLRPECGNQEQNINRFMKRVMTPLSLLGLELKTSINQAKLQFRHARPQEITAAAGSLCVTVPWSYRLFAKVTIQRKASSGQYCNILQQNIRECSGWYQHSQYMNFHKNPQQIIFS